MRRPMLIAALGAFTALAGWAPLGHGCTCAPTGDVFTEVAASEAVFLGTVLEISDSSTEWPYYSRAVTMRVEAVWKGVAFFSTVRISTAWSEISCGFEFRVGGQYVVYAVGAPDGQTPGMWAWLCSRTHETWPEDPDIRLLNSRAPSLILTVAPNPSAERARLAMTITGESGLQTHARLEVLDFQGRRLRTLVNGPTATGTHESFWDGRDDRGLPAPPGIYWARFAWGDRVVTRKLVRMPPR